MRASELLSECLKLFEIKEITVFKTLPKRPTDDLTATENRVSMTGLLTREELKEEKKND